jgi:hypothetical protein
MDWKEYEEEVFQKFRSKYPEHAIHYDKKRRGRYSDVLRQIDILVEANVVDMDLVEIFDCKYFGERVDVREVDLIYGFIDDVGADFGGLVTAEGFTQGARNRSEDANIDLRTVKFESPEDVVDDFVPSLDFSDPRNAIYVAEM